MRKFFVTTFVLAAMLCLATSSMALEKRSALSIDTADDWNAGTTCSINYSNTCTGWVWIWSGFGDGGRLGTVYNTCCSPGESTALAGSTVFALSGPPAGYGYTGTIAVHAVDANDCPVGAAIASQPFLPGSSAAQPVAWGNVSVPNEFAIVLTAAEPAGAPNPAVFGTDHPATGPTGPQACGSCYPLGRVNHSFAYGTTGSPICPGSTFFDGVCDAQLIWRADLICSVSVEPSTWGSIKGLYR
jgi:hypothetical protein